MLLLLLLRRRAKILTKQAFTFPRVRTNPGSLSFRHFPGSMAIGAEYYNRHNLGTIQAAHG